MNALAPVSVNNLTLEQATQRRDILLGQIMGHDLKDLNEAVHGGSKQIDADAMKQRIFELRRVNAQIEKQKQENLDEKSCCWSFKKVQTSTWFVMGTQFFAWLLVGGFAIWDIATSDTDQRRGRSIAEVVITIAALFLTAVVCGVIRGVEDDADRFRLFARISKIEKQGEDHFQIFLEKLEEFKKEKTKEKFSTCIHYYDRLPEDGYRTRIPSRDHWVSLMIQMLPDDHPIKAKFLEFQAVAMKIFELEDVESPSPKGFKLHKKASPAMIEIADEDSDEGSMKIKGKTHKPERKTYQDSHDTSSEESPTVKRKFKGEKAPMASIPSWVKVPEKIKLISVDTDKSDGKELFESIADQPKPAFLVRHQFKEQWRDMEEDLGIKLNCVQMGEYSIDKDGYIADRIDQLPNFVPVRMGGLSLADPVLDPDNAV